jgi:hypothetical protein
VLDKVIYFWDIYKSSEENLVWAQTTLQGISPSKNEGFFDDVNVSFNSTKLLGYNVPADGSILNLSPQVSPCRLIFNWVGNSKLRPFYFDILYNKITRYFVELASIFSKLISSIEKKTLDPT